MKTRLRKGKKKFVASLMLLVLVLTSMLQVVSAAETEEEFQTVTDTAGLLSEEQISGIEEKEDTLEMFDIALYIENKDESECSQEYADDLSQKKYDEVFGSDYKNGVMVVFSFYKEAHGYYAITYGANVEINESKMSSIIEGTYHDFKTDATWVEGAFCQCIDYLKDFEYNIIHADEIKEQKEAESESLLDFIQKAIIIILIIIIIIIICKKKSDENDYIEQIKRFHELYNKELTNNDKLHTDIETRESEVVELQEWKENAVTVCPDIQKKIDEYLAKKQAEKFDLNFSELENDEITSENFEKFQLAVESHNNLSEQAKSYIKTNTKIISEKYDVALKQYAKDAEEQIRERLGKCEGNRYYRDDISSIKNYYAGLPMAVRFLITASLVNRLNNMESSANSDYQRHQQSSSYHSSSHGGTFGGGFHGGGTFGGGFGGGH